MKINSDPTAHGNKFSTDDKVNQIFNAYMDVKSVRCAARRVKSSQLP